MVRNTKPSSLCLALSCAKACKLHLLLHRQGKCLKNRQRPNRSMHFQQAAGQPYVGYTPGAMDPWHWPERGAGQGAESLDDVNKLLPFPHSLPTSH